MARWRKTTIGEIKFDDFPEQLKKIKNCPKILYFRSRWRREIFEKTLVIVGSRKMTRYGREVVEKFMPDLVSNGLTVISGFMYGIDSEAHKRCIENGGTTVAVLGSGLNELPTADNDDLYDMIIDSGGVLVSEYKPDFKATMWSFPQRNRIVAGLATEGVLIVEAGIKSGSLITARIANEQGKKVMAIPGPINSSTSEGGNWLIKNNLATMITESADITGYKNKTVQFELFDSLNDNERLIVNTLSREDMTIDELARSCRMSVSEISVLVSSMAIRDLVREEAGKIFLPIRDR